MNNRLIFFAIFLVLPFSSFSQTYEEQLYNFYLGGDMDSWESVMNKMKADIRNDEDRYQLALAYYGFIGYCVGSDQKKRARVYLDAGEDICESLTLKHPANSQYLSLLGAYQGLRITYQPHKSMVVGPKSLKSLRTAFELEPDNPYTLVENANLDWWMPAMFGGSKDQALKRYEQAISRFDQQPEKLKFNWFYLNIHMILADWYTQKGSPAKATYLYKKVLKIEPRFQWAREKI